MMGERTSSKSGLFLMELIIAIAFFAFSSAICVQLFAKAHTLSARSSNVNMAVTTAQSAAACFKSAGSSLEQLAALMEAPATGDGIVVYYSEDWHKLESADSNSSRFAMTVQLGTSGTLAVANITVSDNKARDPLYELTVKKYFA